MRRVSRSLSSESAWIYPKGAMETSSVWMVMAARGRRARAVQPLNEILEPVRPYLRVGPFSLVDSLGGFAVMGLASPLLSYACTCVGVRVSRTAWLWWTVPLSVAVHLGLQQCTPLTRILSSRRRWMAGLAVAWMAARGARHVDFRAPDPR